jgi:MoaA/NifB/PqqE/SkfB family radical SAM enzyme
MPAINSRDIGLALDMHGCPNRCRHCYVGAWPNRAMSHNDLRWAVEQFKSYVKPGEAKPFIEKLSVMSWTREPDLSDDYERLADLEAELGDGKPTRWELLSIWRLARDPKYAEWAKTVGPNTCQITFFGLQETQDWFHRRPGAFQDCLRATERLLEVGMKPRWQLFLTKKILPDADGLVQLVDKMRLRERVAALGGEFDISVHAPILTGEGRKIAHLSVTLADTRLIPAALVEATKKHFQREQIWATEAETVAEILGHPDPARVPVDYKPAKLWFEIMSTWDVFANTGNTEPWWRLGNLKKDSISAIFEGYETDRPLGYRFNRPEVLPELAPRYGDPKSQRVVNTIEAYWLDSYCMDKQMHEG